MREIIIPLALAALFTFALIPPMVYAADNNTSVTSEGQAVRGEFELRLFELINEHRANNELPPLIWHDSLENVAEYMSNYIVENGFSDRQFNQTSSLAQPVYRKARQLHIRIDAMRVVSIEQRSPEEVFSDLVWLDTNIHGVRTFSNFIGIARYQDTISIVTSWEKPSYAIDRMTATLPRDVFVQRNQDLIDYLKAMMGFDLMEALDAQVIPEANLIIIEKVSNLPAASFEDTLFAAINLSRSAHGLAELAWHDDVQMVSRQFVENFHFNTSVQVEITGPNMRTRVADAGIPFNLVRQSLFSEEFGLEISTIISSLLSADIVNEVLLNPNLTHVGFARNNANDLLVIKWIG